MGTPINQRIWLGITTEKGHVAINGVKYYLSNPREGWIGLS